MLYLLLVGGGVIALVLLAGVIFDGWRLPTATGVAAGLVIGFIVLPAAVFAVIVIAFMLDDEKHHYRPPPGTPTEIRFAFRLQLKATVADQPVTGEVVEMLTAKPQGNPSGMSDYMWTLSGDRLAVSVPGHPTIKDRGVSVPEYARWIIESCLRRNRPDNFAALAAALSAVTRCDGLELEDFWSGGSPAP